MSRKKTKNQSTNESSGKKETFQMGTLELSKEEKFQLDLLKQSRPKTFRINLHWMNEEDPMVQWYKKVCKIHNVSTNKIPAWMIDLFDQSFVEWNND